jgi:hypothetical protein
MQTSSQCWGWFRVVLASLITIVDAAPTGTVTSTSPPSANERTTSIWTNVEGKKVEASFEGIDEGTHVLLRLSSGELHRYPIAKLSFRSREMAQNRGKPKSYLWTNRNGQSLLASYEGMEGTDRVLLKPPTGVLHSYDIANLSPESRQRALNEGYLPKLSVIVLGDSMSLGGFGKQLDKKFRNSSGFGTVNTYMACGSNPLSWMTIKPYSNASTHCGYWSIESNESAKPRELKDVKTPDRDNSPDVHTIPKIEKLLLEKKPQVLIIQSGNNFFSFFEDGETINEEYHNETIAAHLKPMVDFLTSEETSLRKVFWITPPQAGSVTEKVQDFVFSRIKLECSKVATIIDSRRLTKFPYEQMGADKEHFWGKDAEQWAEKVYELVIEELFAEPIMALPPVNKKVEISRPNPSRSIAEPIRVKATLKFTTKLPPPESFAPYQELLISQQYEIQEVISGSYSAKSIMVLHPAYIKLKKQTIKQNVVGETYEIEVLKLDSSSLWNTVRREEGSDEVDLEPYLLVEDENIHPDFAKK